MKKLRLKTLLKFSILIFGILTLTTNCEKNSPIESEPNEIIEDNTSISITSVPYSDFDNTFDALKNKFNIDSHINNDSSSKTYSKTYSKTTSVKSNIVICTDVVKKITKGDYASYTMLIESLDDDPNTFYNITIEEKNGTSGVFVTQYKTIPQKSSAKASFSKTSSSSSETLITTRTIDSPEEPIGPEDFGNEDGGTGSGGSSGGGGGSTTYPTDCDGTVSTTSVVIDTNCGCGHTIEDLMLGICTGCQRNYPTWPSRETVTVYECIPSSINDPNTGGGTGTGGGGSSGSGDSGNPADTSITTPINQDGSDEECLLSGDLNGDCMIDSYEACVIDNGRGICDDYYSIREEIPFARLDRYLELIELIKNDPWALIQNCAQQNGMDTSNYIDLYNHTTPQECQTRLDNLGFGYSNQPISNGNVPCANVDYYGVEVTNYPDFNNDGNPDTEAEIYQAFREKFTDLASGQKDDFQFSCNVPNNDANTGDINWEFVPLSTNDANLFVSNNPLTAILFINAGVNIEGMVGENLTSDEGTIIVSGYNANNWTISTITSPQNGSQPFSGNRQWGWLINQNGNLEFYTRAVDVAKVNKLLNVLPGTNTECQQDTYYNIAEVTWQNLQQEIKDWIVNEGGGQALVNTPKAVRVKKETIEEILTTNESINQILSNCN